MDVKVRRLDTFEGAFQALKDEISKYDPTVLSISAAIVIILLTLVIFLTRRKNNKNVVILAGLCDAGKTLLFSRLVHNKFVNTYTSIKENSGIYQVTGRKITNLEVVDIPGNDRQRMQFWDRFKPQARGVIFVVDSSNFQSELKEVAEFMYSLLADRSVTQGKLPVLIACNKQDLTIAKSSKVIKEKLEKEINLLRVTRSSAMGSTDGSTIADQYLGAKGKDFKFIQLAPVKVVFVECSAKGGNDESCAAELNKVEEWIQSIV